VPLWKKLFRNEVTSGLPDSLQISNTSGRY